MVRYQHVVASSNRVKPVPYRVILAILYHHPLHDNVTQVRCQELHKYVKEIHVLH
jgi:hypothetical protein